MAAGAHIMLVISTFGGTFRFWCLPLLTAGCRLWTACAVACAVLPSCNIWCSAGGAAHSFLQIVDDRGNFREDNFSKLREAMGVSDDGNEEVVVKQEQTKGSWRNDKGEWIHAG